MGRATAAIKATPAVRALARQLDVELTMVTPSGTDGVITAADVQRVAKILTEVGPAEILRGVRRTMAQNMTLAQSEVAAATVIDDADIEAWLPGADVTVRLVRALVAGCYVEPGLNAWFESRTLGRRVLKKIDVGIAVDLPDGLFVPVLRDVANRDAADLRRGLDRMRADLVARRIPPEEMRGNTVTLSNFGMIGGKYSAPIVIPPTVAILGAGRISQQVVAVSGVPAVHRVLPLSLTFDHRVVTGGEAARFLVAAIDDLTLAT
jgi:pyruvate dehydrogenase E2 component (dihydrolipoamide acetyltransferase)